MNNAAQAADVSVTWQQIGVVCGVSGCAVRDIWKHADIGRIAGGYSAQALPSRDSLFLIISP